MPHDATAAGVVSNTVIADSPPRVTSRRQYITSFEVSARPVHGERKQDTRDEDDDTRQSYVSLLRGFFPALPEAALEQPESAQARYDHGLCACVVGERWFRTPTCIAWATTLFSGTHAAVAERASEVATTAAAAGAAVPAPRKLSMAEKLKLKMRALMKNTVGT